MSKKTQKRNRVLVTAGPTRAYLDAVRFLSNPSTGATGYAICEAFLSEGWEVFLVAGPCPQEFNRLALSQYVAVESTEEMAQAVSRICAQKKPEVAILSAAVLDFEPRHTLKTKTSSSKVNWRVDLKPTRKIIDEIVKRFPKTKVIGFKLEAKRRAGVTRERFARNLLKKKRLSGLCLNFLSEVGPKKHRAYLYSESATVKETKTKAQMAKALVELSESLVIG